MLASPKLPLSTMLKASFASMATPMQAPIVAQASSGSAGACRSLPCLCTGRPDGNYTNPFANNQLMIQDKTPFVACKAGMATALACPTAQHFDASRQACELPDSKIACLRSPSCFCIGRPDGLHLPFPAVPMLAYLCIRGGGLRVTCPEGTTWETETGICATRFPASAPGATCRELACFCKNKKPGPYPNVFATGDALKQAYQPTYIQCANGAATLAQCAKGQLFDSSSAGMKCFVPPLKWLSRGAPAGQPGPAAGKAGPGGA
jgi:hypothetical protein